MPASRVEVITSTERRRSYTDAERAAILAECAEPDAVIAAVARRYGIAESLIYGWRSKRRADAALASEPLQFIPYSAVAAAPVAEVPAAVPATVPAPEPPRPVSAAAAVPPTGALRPAVGTEPGAIVVDEPKAYFAGLAARVLRWIERSMPGSLRAALHPDFPGARAGRRRGRGRGDRRAPARHAGAGRHRA